jgi:uncharacterized protein
MPTEPLDDHDVAALLQALDDLPRPFEPLDASAIDGFLTGVALQRAPLTKVWRSMLDPEDCAPTIGADQPPVRRVLNVLESRRRQLDGAIEQRSWFDPWVFEPDASSSDPIREACAPWAAGFALAMEGGPGWMRSDAPGLVDALALIYVHFDADDLEDADDLLAAIDELEPARDLAEAVEDLVTATLRLADIGRPRPPPNARRAGNPTRPTQAASRRRRPARRKQ